MIDLQWNKAFALEQTAGDEELLEELLILFKGSATADYAQLQQAVVNNDPDAVMRAAHSLKGAAASLGIEGIRRLAYEMEADGRKNSILVAREKLTAMGELLAQLQAL